MGSSSSKFRKALQRGEGVEAMHIYLKHPDIKRNLDPNNSFGVNHRHNTALHYAALHGIKAFVREFLEERANPNIRNEMGQNSFHCICLTNRGTEGSVDKTRAECLTNLLKWNWSNQDEATAEIDAKDEFGNTPLHYAARSGLYHCVQVLVADGASLYEENQNGDTACDFAIKGGFNAIASFLESRMVFSESASPIDADLEEPVFNQDDLKQYRGLCAQDLQEAKDLMLVETADMLRVPLFTEICSICDGEIVYEDVSLSLSCGHEFCRSCWESYLNVKIKEGKAHNIQCPGFDCSSLVPVETIESLVSREMASRYLQFDIKAFVESNPNLKWCPSPGCGQAVRLPSSMLPSSPVAVDSYSSKETEAMIVDCGKGHFFCCSNLTLINYFDIKYYEGAFVESNPNLKWCPSPGCGQAVRLPSSMLPSSPVAVDSYSSKETEAMICKYEFCWVCLEQWKKHSSATGGYFRCNRFEVVQKVESESAKLVTEASQRNAQVQELNCFLHYYSRFKNHENSYKFEEPLLSTAKDKMTALALQAMETAATSFENPDTSFIEDAVHKLLSARRVLRSSYPYGYFLTGNMDKKAIFESMQTEVEEATETLSQMVARPYLRTPRARVIQVTQLLHRKQQDFLLALSRGVIPDEIDQSGLEPRLSLVSPLDGMPDSESDEDEDNYDEVHSILGKRLLARLELREHLANGETTAQEEQGAGTTEKWNCDAIHKKFNLTSGHLCRPNGAHKIRNRMKRRRRQSQPVENDEEVDIDFMRAIQLSLLPHSTPANEHRCRSSSSSSSAGSGQDQAQGLGGEQDISVFSDSTSLQKAIELSIDFSSLPHKSDDDDDELKRAIKLSLLDSGLSSIRNDGSENKGSYPHQQNTECQDSDSNSEYDVHF
ncbi:PREDICTED: ankyrin repeat and IBR domain-containing protein 1-like [Acropora digitifera]|uniref:ankyrin repeat and IBR domain-containing protein 1-like n=1 Tax=Acropora digitifera TaxID=70779 RepID=UPI00077A606A|nr:PREDICTED: ankyrin repeat and IBR domain-containing protein 1-like [Acropora digitifera]